MATIETVKKIFAMVFFKFPSRRPRTHEEGEIALKAWCKIYNRVPDDVLMQAAERFYGWVHRTRALLQVQSGEHGPSSAEISEINPQTVKHGIIPR